MHKVLCLCLIVFAAFTFSATGQKLWQKKGYELVYPVCYASDRIEKSFVPPPATFNKNLKSAEKKSEIVVSYSRFPEEAHAAFEYATHIWEQLIESPVPIYILAHWRDQEANVLASCGPTDFSSNFPGAPKKDIYYPIALVEKIRGEELTPVTRADMVAVFNENINWYYGTDGNTPSDKYDLVSVALHEIGHGLGFTGFFTALRLTGGYSWLEWGDASAFDQLVENTDGEKLTDTTVFENPSSELRDALVSNALYADSPAARAFGFESRPRLYAPQTWNDGSSIYHLNTGTYTRGNENSLMTHSFGRGEAIHHPGPATLGILTDMGWGSIIINHTPLLDLEALEPMQFDITVSSNFPLETENMFLIYFTDSLVEQTDSIPLENAGEDLYSASLQIDPETQLLSYYFSIQDTLGRIVTSPAGAPHEVYSVGFGPDMIKPTISHEPVTFFLDTGQDLEITVNAADNVGIDTVMVTYSINGMVQPDFGLTHISGTTYTGKFPFEENTLNDMDLITYQIIARDASNNQNETQFPENDFIDFYIEKLFSPADRFESDFGTGHHNFTLNQFGIYTDEGFTNEALHSPHPYPSPEVDDETIDFITILKRPVILKEPAIMEFDEVVLVEPGTTQSVFGDFDFWDYVIVEGSKDNGNNWLPLADGYDSGSDSLWKQKFTESIALMNSTTVGTAELFKSRQIDMLENGNFSADDTLLIRFRLFADAYAHGWGWAIDNLKIQMPVTTTAEILTPGKIRVYPNPFTGFFNVLTEPGGHIELLQYDLYNMQGQIVATRELRNVSGPVTTGFNLYHGAPGVYFLVVKENGKRVLSKKIIHN